MQKKVISEVGFEIAKNGLPEEISPPVIGFTGYGNVSNGAQEIVGLLPLKEITPVELLELKNQNGIPTNVVYKVVFREEDLSIHKNPDQEFDLQDYYTHPENYKDQFAKYIEHLSVLMNCMYWDDRYPRIITKEYLEEIYKKEIQNDSNWRCYLRSGWFCRMHF